MASNLDIDNLVKIIRNGEPQDVIDTLDRMGINKDNINRYRYRYCIYNDNRHIN